MNIAISYELFFSSLFNQPHFVLLYYHCCRLKEANPTMNLTFYTKLFETIKKRSKIKQSTHFYIVTRLCLFKSIMLLFRELKKNFLYFCTG